MYIIVGLGNVGKKYSKNRHNVGFMALDYCVHPDMWLEKKGLSCFVAEDTLAGEQVIYAKPTTMMNLSGKAVRMLSQMYDVPPSRIVVIYDDLDIALGDIKISFDRGNAGHNGIKSLEKELGTREFVRMRVGVSPVYFGTMRRPKGESVSGYVLKDFGILQKPKLEGVFIRVKEALEILIREGREKSMNRVNG